MTNISRFQEICYVKTWFHKNFNPCFGIILNQKNQTHIMVLSAQVIIVHQKNKLLTQTCQIFPNCSAIWPAVWFKLLIFFHSFVFSWAVFLFKFCKHMLILLIKVKGCWYFWCCCPKIQRMCCFGQHRGHACGARKRE